MHADLSQSATILDMEPLTLPHTTPVINNNNYITFGNVQP